MTIALLAAVSLLALVVASRPIQPDADLCDLASAPSALQTVLQPAFQIHPGKDDLKLNAARFQFQKPKQQIECFSALDTDSVAAVASFEISPGVTPVVETPLGDTANGQDVPGIHSDSLADERAASESETDEQPAVPPLAVLAFSCVAALLALACVALTLYIVRSLRSQVFVTKVVWEPLSRFWGRPDSQEATSAKAKATKHLSDESQLLLQADPLADVEEGRAETHGLRTQNKPLFVDAVSDMESECGDIGEKYQDALDTTPLPLFHDLPPEENVPHLSHFDDPALPPAETCPLDPPTGDRSALLMRELCSSPIPRPAWSVRAIDSPALGIASREGDGVASTPQPLIPRRRAYRSTFPEIDIALAMQLRPGLGIGADSAWMVRFLMTIFGWFAVALTGRTQ